MKKQSPKRMRLALIALGTFLGWGLVTTIAPDESWLAWQGYHSDLARTIYVPRAGETEAPEAERAAFASAKEAIDAAFAAMRPGVLLVNTGRGALVDTPAVVEGLKSGAIDVIHSAHDPQDSEVKRQPFAEANEGAIGLETLLAAALRLVHSGDVPLMTIPVVPSNSTLWSWP